MQKAGWFSSLKRQPKSSTKLKQQQAAKKLQQSCVDLSTSPIIAKDADDSIKLSKCEQCLTLFDPALNDIEKALVSKNKVVNLNIGAQYSEYGTTSISRTVNIDKVQEIRKLKDFASEYTEKISITRTTTVKRPTRRIEFFQPTKRDGEEAIPDIVTYAPQTTTATTTSSSYNNRNGLVFDENGKVLNALNFDFEYIDTDNVIAEKPKSPDSSGVKWIVNPVHTMSSPSKLCATCRNNANNRFKSKSEWNLSSSKVLD